MQGLAIGRIVHYITHHGKVRPAIVTDVIDKVNGRVSLHVFLDANDSPGMAYDPKIGAPGAADYSEKPEPMTWHWPPRVD